VQRTNGAPSIEHSNVALDSVDVNSKTTVEPDGSGGESVIVVSGAMVSTLHACVAGVGSVLPVASIALTSKVWEPSSSGPNVSPLVQAANGAPSTEHSKVAVLSGDENVNVGVGSLDGLVGVVSITVSGARVSTLHACVAGVGSVLPVASIALTSKVWEPSLTE
jgi:hypothetical protein